MTENSNTSSEWVYFRVKRPEGYEDTHEEIVMADFLDNPDSWQVELSRPTLKQDAEGKPDYTSGGSDNG